MRVLIPTTGEEPKDKAEYETQYLGFLETVGLPAPDKTATDTKRLFFPTMMQGLTQPPRCGKPTDQSYKKAKKLYKHHKGVPYKMPSVQEVMKNLIKVIPKAYTHNARTGKYSKSSKETVELPGDTMLYHRGKEIGTFETLAADGDLCRCDCPFDSTSHANGGADYAFVQGKKIICQSNSHGHLMAVMPDELFGMFTNEDR